jgi:hypothetical protein
LVLARFVILVLLAVLPARVAHAGPKTPAVLQAPNLTKYPSVRVYLDLLDTAWSGGEIETQFQGQPDAALLEAVDQAKDLFQAAEEAGEPLGWPAPPEPPALTAAATASDFASRSEPEEGLLIAFLIDGTASMNGEQEGAWSQDPSTPYHRARLTAEAVLQQLKPADRVMIARIYDGLEILVQPTDDLRAARQALDTFEFGKLPKPRLFDALAKLVDETLHQIPMPNLPGRRAVFLFSDGDKHGSDDVIELFGTRYNRLADPPTIFTVGVGRSGQTHRDLERIAMVTGRAKNFLESPTPKAVVEAFSASLEPLARQVRVEFDAPLFFWRKGDVAARVEVAPAGGEERSVGLDLHVEKLPDANAVERDVYLAALAENKARVDAHLAGTESTRQWTLVGGIGGGATLLLLILVVLLTRRRSRQLAAYQHSQEAGLARLQDELGGRLEEQEAARKIEAEQARATADQKAQELARQAANQSRTALAVLFAIDGPLKGRRYGILRSPCVTGREADKVDLAFPADGGDSAISRVHAEFRLGDDGWGLTSLSDGKTLVNGTRLRKGDRYPLKAGDHVGLGGSVLRFDNP